MKKLFTLLLALMATTALWAEDFEVDGIYYKVLTDKTNEVAVTYRGSSYNEYYNEYSGSVIIPSTVTYNGTTYSVTSIGDNAFTGCSSLTSITIPNSVTSIGNQAFYGCSGLTSVTIGSSVTSIGYSAFYECSKLTAIIWNARNGHDFSYSMYDPMNDPFIGIRSQIRSFTIGESVERIPSCLCYDMTALTSINIPNSVTSIGDLAFYGSSISSFKMPNSVIQVGGGVLAHCTNLTEVQLSENITDLPAEKMEEIDGSYIGFFSYCKSLRSITIPEKITSIGACAFNRCESLTSVVIPNTVTNVGGGLFSGCTNLTEVQLSENITSLPANGPVGPGRLAGFFYNCVSLRSITIPEKVTSIGDGGFEGCLSLTSVHIPNNVTMLGGGLFSGCTNLVEVQLPDNFKRISSANLYCGFTESQIHFFENCSSLRSIIIPKSVKVIDAGSFKGCSSLASILIEEGNTVYDSHNNCNAIIDSSSNTLVAGCWTTIIPNNIIAIGNSAFYGCSGLTSITIPKSVTSIGDEAFYGCSGLSFVTCEPTTPPALGTDAFTSSPFAYVLCGTKEAYSNSMWGQYTSDFEEYIHLLYSGDFGDEITWKYDKGEVLVTGKGEMPSECYPWTPLIDSIQSIDVTNGITSISEYAFANCKRLTKVTLPASLEEIGANAFDNCPRLYEIYSYASLPPIAQQSSFYNYNADVYVPCEVLSFYEKDIVFSLFPNLQCVSSDEVETDSIVINAGTTDVTITWPTDDNADTYTIVIEKDGEVVCTLTFNAEGQLLNIAFAPGRQGNHPAQYAEQANNGYRFTVTGLEEGTDYTYTITTKDASNKTISEHSGEFTTNSATALDNINSSSSDTQKILRDGQLLIIRDGKTYNAQGVELK